MVELRENGNLAFEIFSCGKLVGVIEYKSFWQGMPYLSLIRIAEEYRGKGIGSEAMRLFEDKLRSDGERAVLVSTQVDECAQHFYRKLGYRECGCLILEDTPFSQPMEMFFIKVL
ncbi:MAG: GNAT family N-acetyltransferase [Clostridia bacterium]|nr:GNAT family N-acetyltransferase [Clostridia bacterium]